MARRASRNRDSASNNTTLLRGSIMLKMHSKPKPRKLLDVVVRLSERDKNGWDHTATYANVLEVIRHTQELEIVQCDGRHTFLNASDFVSYWYTDQ